MKIIGTTEEIENFKEMFDDWDCGDFDCDKCIMCQPSCWKIDSNKVQFEYTDK